MAIEIGSHYRLRLRTPWNTVHIVKILGISDYANVTKFGAFDIKSKWFTPNGIGLSTFLTTVTDVPIYVCSPVKATYPVEYEDKPIFIPASMVDLQNVIDVLECKVFALRTNEIVRHYDGPVAEYEAQSTLTKRIETELLRVGELAGESIEVSIDGEAIGLFEKPFLDDEVARRNEVITKTNEALLQAEYATEAERNKLYTALEVTQQAKRVYDTQVVALDKARQDAYNARVAFEDENARLTYVKTVMVEMIAQIQQGTFTDLSNFPSFDQLYLEAENALHG